MRSAPLEVVYLLGNSFSGSTVLSFLMAGSPEVRCLGELKMHNRLGQRICSCGTSAHECPFWMPWDARGYQLYSGSLADKLKLSARLLSGRRAGGAGQASDDLVFLREIKAATGNPKLLLDTSKSVWRLAQLARIPDIELKVIHVRRRMHGTVASSVKRYDQFWRPLAGYLCNNLLCERFFALHPEVRRLEVRHEDLCDDPDGVMTAIGSFLGIDYTGYRDYLETLEPHVRTGNWRTIKQQQSGLRLRSSREEEELWKDVFGPLQGRLLDLLAGRAARRPAGGPGRQPG